MTVSRGKVSNHWGYMFLKLSADKLLVFTWWQAQLQVDFFFMVTSLLFEVNYKFISGSSAFNLAFAKSIIGLKLGHFVYLNNVFIFFLLQSSQEWDIRTVSATLD